MHGGASPGAPRGPANGAYRTGLWTKAAIAERRAMAALIRSSRSLLYDL
jgi:hypothetical protein